MTHIQFLHPIYLTALLVALPIVYGALYLGLKLRAQARKAYGEERLVERYSEPLKSRSERIVRVLWLTAFALVLLALAGPTSPDAPVKVKAGTLQVVVVSDVSKSMAAEDYRADMPPKNGIPASQVPGPYGTRLQMVRMTVENQIMPAIVGNELGISTFCGNGFDQADLTDDFVSLRWVLDNWVDIGNAPGGGSDYAEGLKEALTIFDITKEPHTQKVIVMFSDGGFTGDPANLAKVIEQIRERGIRVIIVGVGSDTPNPIPVYDPATLQLTGYLQKDSKTVTTAIDEASLRNLAAQMDATYIRLMPGSKLDIPWASKLAGEKAESHKSDLYQYPLALGLALILILFVRGLLPGFNRKVRS